MPHTAYLWIAILPVCMAFGAFYCAVRHTGSALIGAIYGCFIGGGIMMFEKGAPFPQLRDRLHRLSWLLSNAGTEVIYLVLTIVGAGLAGGLMWSLGLNGESLAEALVIHPPAIL